MKSFAHSLLARAAASLPWGAREAIFDRLCERKGRYEALSAIARTVNVRTFQVAGDYGVIQSSSNDVTVLATYAATGRFADRSNMILKSFFDKHDGGTYLDIGANIGLTTIPVAQNARVACLAIEPEPTNYENLVANVARNCLNGNVQTRQVAIFSKTSKLDFELATDNLGDHRLRLTDTVGQLAEEGRKVISVDAVPLDSIAPVIEGKLAVKIDVQGAEPFVFEGGMQTLAQADLVITEFWPYSMIRMGANPQTVIDFFKRNSFTLSLASGEGGALSAPASAMDVAEELIEFASIKAEDCWAYLDIIAMKESC